MRINIFGGPCSGKSTVAAQLFCQLRIQGTEVELIQEYVKDWAYEERQPKSFDQLYFLAKQIRRESLILDSGIDHIVTDSPVLMSCVYAFLGQFPGASNLVGLCEHFEAAYPSLNLFLDRGDLPYKKVGRYQTYEEAKELDGRIRGILDATSTRYVVLPATDIEQILSVVQVAIEEVENAKTKAQDTVVETNIAEEEAGRNRGGQAKARDE